MNGIKFAHKLGFRLSSGQRRAFVWLERRGYRFCIDFGVQNCVAMIKQRVPARRLAA